MLIKLLKAYTTEYALWKLQNQRECRNPQNIAHRLALMVKSQHWLFISIEHVEQSTSLYINYKTSVIISWICHLLGLKPLQYHTHSWANQSQTSQQASDVLISQLWPNFTMLANFHIFFFFSIFNFFVL